MQCVMSEYVKCCWRQLVMVSRMQVQRTMTEREILAFADHPFIVRLYYAFQTKRFLYMVMQLCEGGHLHQTIRAQPHGFLCEDMARFYAAEVLVVLEYLHMMGVLYEGLHELRTAIYIAPEVLASHKGHRFMPPLIPKPIRLTPALTDQLEDPPCACDLVAPDDDQFYSFNFTRTCMGDDLPL
ncbi:hypothetical protein DYB32_010494 [Aphanomyces invadans]|uniref:non-specific serine/threonine protein kinase n=1 Tax=Aphanomyces invadans TaxID=157072 RepID=A0A418AFL8_9STRA|nr:hypothetical protein DYB32_010494 [Aphanomyces invadans]